MANNFTQFNLPVQAYATFDAVSLKQLMVDRLKQSGLFPDIDYEGSNINAITDVIAFAYHLLLFYLNQTASEALFNQATLLENMNKIVSLIGYNPTGKQTALLNFEFIVDDYLPPDFYTLIRYSYINVNGIPYSFNTDVSFQKSVPGTEQIDAVSQNFILCQGKYREYPLYTAIGEDFEQFTLALDSITDEDDTFIDNNNVSIYVKDVYTGKWSEWKQVDSLFFAGSDDKVYEKRLNEFNRYEIKFGNNINGLKLNPGDQVAVYYLESMGSKGVVGPNTINNTNIVLFSSTQFEEIKRDIFDPSINFLDARGALAIKLRNPQGSTQAVNGENVDQIRQNAPILFASQNQLVTLPQYKTYISKNFSNIVSAISVVGNSEFTSEYLKYFYDIGLQRPNENLQVLLNQVSFASSCNFNNINIFAVPAFGSIVNETTPNYLPQSLKQYIINQLNQIKAINHEIVIHDPVYIAFDLGIAFNDEELSVDVREDTRLIITRERNSVLSKSQIQVNVYNTIINFFKQTSTELGGTIDLAVLSQQILSLDGVSSLATSRTINNRTISVPKLSFVAWNPEYQFSDVSIVSQNVALPFFKYPFLYEQTKLQNKIIVV